MTGSNAPASSPTTGTIPTEYVHRAAWKAGVLGALNVITAILAVRLILLVAVCGAVALSYLVLQQPGPYPLGVLGVYAGVVLVPLIWLAARR
jgi:hypothetical protein